MREVIDSDENVVNRVAANVLNGEASPVNVPRLPRRTSLDKRDAEQTGASSMKSSYLGRQLPSEERFFFETRLGHDLGHVRIHADSVADSINREVGSQALVQGADIFFRHDAFEPKSRRGKELIAHELVHVLRDGESSGIYPQRRLGPTVQPQYVDIRVRGTLKTVQVYNILGTIVQSIVPQSKTISLDLSGLPEGVYFVEATTDTGEVATKKFTNLGGEVILRQRSLQVETPSKEKSTDSVSLSFLGVVKRIEVFDVTGKRLRVVVPESDKFSFDLADYGEGLYFLQADAGSESVAKKITKTSAVVKVNVRQRISPSAAPATPSIPAAVDGGSDILDQVNLQSASLSFSIPGKTVLKSDPDYQIVTEKGTTAGLSVSQERLSLRFSPALVVEIPWVPDVDWSGLDYDFRSGTISSVGLKGLLSFKVEPPIREFVLKAFSSTRVAIPGYNPFQDADLKATLNVIKKNLTEDPDNSGGTSSGPSLGAFTNISVAAALQFKSEIKRLTSSGGVRLAAGGAARIQVTFEGSAATLVNPAEAKIKLVKILSDSIFLVDEKGGEVARLKETDYSFGGKVDLKEIEPLAVMKKTGEGLEGLELGIRTLFALLLLRETRSASVYGPPPVQVPKPELVGALKVVYIENALSDAIREALLQNCSAVPGVDLCRAFGIKSK